MKRLILTFIAVTVAEFYAVHVFRSHPISRPAYFPALLTAIQFWMGESGHCLHYPIGGDRKGDINFFLVERTPTTWPIRQSTGYAADGEQLRLFKDWHPALVEMISSNTLTPISGSG